MDDDIPAWSWALLPLFIAREVAVCLGGIAIVIFCVWIVLHAI
jgi:hypothetical protein